MVTDIEFLAANWLWLLLIIFILALLLRYSWQKRKAKLLLFNPNLHKLASISKYPFVTHLIIIGLLVLALARPSIGYKEHVLNVNSGDYIFILDISHSMLANDIMPSRLDVARRKISDMLELLKERQPGSRAALILYAGSAYTFCPPTQDFTAFKIFLNSVNVNLIDAPGSDLLGAVKLAITIQKAANTNADIVIMSDFEEHNPNDDSLIVALKASNSKLHLLGLGTKEGGPIRFDNGRFLRDQSGNFIISKLNVTRLESLGNSLASSTNISSLNNSDLDAILNASSGLELEQSRTIRTYNEIGPLLTLSALLVILLAWLKQVPSILFTISLLLTLNSSFVSAEDLNTRPIFDSVSRIAAKEYKKGNYEAAKKLYEQALQLDPHNKKLLAGLAASQYQLNNPKEAIKNYEELLNSAKNGREKFEALYNIGTSQLSAKNYSESIKSLENALKIKPDDQPTKTNLEIAKKLKEEEQKQQQEQDNKQQNKEQQQKDNEQKKSDNDNTADNKNEQQQSQKDEQGQPDSANKNNEQQNQPESNDSKEDEQNKQDKSEQTNPTDSEDQEKQSSSDEEQKSKEAKQQNTEESKGDSGTKLSQEQAKAWLESLPDAPIILRRDIGHRRPKAGEQTW